MLVRKSSSIGPFGPLARAGLAVGLALAFAGHSFAAAVPEPGSLDLSFNPIGDLGSGLDGPVFSIASQPDGRVVLGGYFQHYDGESHPGIVRLQEDGKLDRSFVPGALIGNVTQIGRRSDGSLVVFGQTRASEVMPCFDCLQLLCLREDGSVDERFTVTGLTSAFVIDLAISADDSVVAVGRFTLPGFIAKSMIRLGPNGQLLGSVAFGGGFEAQHVDLEPDGTALVMGVFLNEDDRYQPRVYRVRPNGEVDPDFGPEFPTFSSPQPYGFGRQTDGRLLLFGPGQNDFFESVWVFRRYSATGALDPSFQPIEPPGRAFLAQRDGSTILAGVEVIRLGPSGGIDGSFAISMASVEIQAMAEDNQGRLLIGGYFQAVSGVPRGFVARLYGGSGAPGPPVVRRQLGSQLAAWGQPVTLEAVFGANPPAQYRWYQDGVLQAVTEQSRRLLPSVTSADAGQHFIVASNAFGVATSAVAFISVSSWPQIILGRRPLLAVVGGDVTLDAKVYGRPPLGIQWFHAQEPIPGANKPSLKLTQVTLHQTGEYTLLVTNQLRQAMATADVTVIEPLRLGTPVSWVPNTLSFPAIGPPFHRIHLQQSPDFARWTTVNSVDLGASTGQEITVPIVPLSSYFFRLKLGE